MPCALHRGEAGARTPATGSWIRGFARAIGHPARGRGLRAGLARGPSSAWRRSRRGARLRALLPYGVKVLSRLPNAVALPGGGRVGLAQGVSRMAPKAEGDRDPPRAWLHAQRDPHGLGLPRNIRYGRAAVAAGRRQALHREHVPQRERAAPTGRSGSTGGETAGGSRTNGATLPTRPLGAQAQHRHRPSAGRRAVLDRAAPGYSNGACKAVRRGSAPGGVSVHSLWRGGPDGRRP